MPQNTTILGRPLAAALTGTEMIPIDDPHGPSSLKTSVGAVASLAAIDPASVATIVANTNTTSSGVAAMAGPLATVATNTGATTAALSTVNTSLSTALTTLGTIAAGVAALPVNVAGALPVSVAGTIAAQSPTALAGLAGTMYGVYLPPVAPSTTAMVPLVALVNPVGSGRTIAVVQSTIATGPGLGITRTRYALPACAITGTAAAAAGRGVTLATPVAAGGRVFTAPTVSGTGTVERMTLLAATGTESTRYDGDLLLSPGTALVWAAEALGSLTGLVGLAGQTAAEITWREW